MKILVVRWDIYPYENIIHTLKKQGHSVDVLAFPIASHISDPEFASVLENRLDGYPQDIVFSVNYFAVIGEICFRRNVPYVSWNCDTPLLSMRHPSVYYPTNYIFTFDRAECRDFQRRGVPHIHYLPLAGGSSHTDSLSAKSPVRRGHAASPSPEPPTDSSGCLWDISFLGSLYEKNRYEEMAAVFPGYLRGYLDAIVEGGKHLSGGDFISQMLPDEMLSQISQYVSLEGTPLPQEALRIHLETSVLSYKIAADTRREALWLLSQNHRVDLFTSTPLEEASESLPPSETLHIHPPVDYQTEMPEVFRRSRINLNFTIPNITDGIPLRVFDVLSAGGFLLTDYRDALCGLFQEGEELAVYRGMGDLLQKAGYYLSHPQEREEIARRGMEKARSLHSYSHRLDKIFQILHNSNS